MEPTYPDEYKCGVKGSSSRSGQRIFHGGVAREGEWPWMAYLSVIFPEGIAGEQKYALVLLNFNVKCYKGPCKNYAMLFFVIFVPSSMLQRVEDP